MEKLKSTNMMQQRERTDCPPVLHVSVERAEGTTRNWLV
jgi:hypothetical protein